MFAEICFRGNYFKLLQLSSSVSEVRRGTGAGRCRKLVCPEELGRRRLTPPFILMGLHPWGHTAAAQGEEREREIASLASLVL